MGKIVIILLIITSQLFSQESFVIKSVRLFDGEQVKENVSVLIKDGEILKISSKKIKNLSVIDGKGKTMLPALTNAHVHVWAPFQLRKSAKAGILNVMDMHIVESTIPLLKIYRDSTNYADFYCGGGAATVPNGHGTQYGFTTPTLTKPSEAKDFVANRIKNGADYIKIIKEPWKVTLDSTTVAELITESHLQNRKAVVHISNTKDAFDVLKNKADGLVHIWHKDKMTEEQLNELKKEQFFIIPTLLTNQEIQKVYHKRTNEQVENSINQLKKELFRLYELKVPILAGTDPPNANINYDTDLFKEMILLKESGISTIDVLKSATSLPALHFNLKNKGFIKEGYRADFILIEGNPTESIKDIYNTKRVFKQGKEIR